MSILVRHFFSGTRRASKSKGHFYQWVAHPHPQRQWDVIGLWRRPRWWPWPRSRCCRGWRRTSRSLRTSADRGTFPSEATRTDLWLSRHTRTFQFGTLCGWWMGVWSDFHSHLQSPGVARASRRLWSSETWFRCRPSTPGREQGPQAQSRQFLHFNIFKKCQYIDYRYVLSIYDRTPLHTTVPPHCDSVYQESVV